MAIATALSAGTVYSLQARAQEKLLEVEARMADPVVTADSGRYGDIARRYKQLEEIVAAVVNGAEVTA